MSSKYDKTKEVKKEKKELKRLFGKVKKLTKDKDSFKNRDPKPF